MLEAASSFLSRRALHWDMSTVYPGLVLKVGPSLPGSGGGILQFILDRRHPSNFDERTLNTVTRMPMESSVTRMPIETTVASMPIETTVIRMPIETTVARMPIESSVARHLLVRQMVLPMILGMKINLTALIPLFFLVVALISKKAMLFSKLAVLVSGFLGLNSLFLLQRHQQQQQYSYNHDNRPYFGGSFSNLGPQLFKGVSHKEDQTARGGGRNFLWEDTDKFNRD
uniref:Uncharacterized protein n=1 Tax=Timema poppense TaxID=170557 RepID=A0A7R9H5F8_TIMPO|nr:unnamed protein product [Timema poppensis]